MIELSEIQSKRLQAVLILTGSVFLCIGFIGWDGSRVLREHHSLWESLSRVWYYLPAGIILLVTQVHAIKIHSPRWFSGAIVGFAIYSTIYFARDLLSIGRFDNWLTDILLFPSYIFGSMSVDPFYPFLLRQYGMFGYGPRAYLMVMWFGAFPLAFLGALFGVDKKFMKPIAICMSLLYLMGCLFWAGLLISDLLGYHYLD